jgi:NAD-dependent oxidoreductase involved in siderophore biosynthesis
MKTSRFGKSLWSAVAALLLVALASAPACAQCAMCRAAFNGGSGAALAQSLNRGIIVLLIPPVVIFCAIFITAIKYRKATDVSSGKIL